ncbi:MAG: GIDE domain-containing protein [Panacagrimonas sp.]
MNDSIQSRPHPWFEPFHAWVTQATPETFWFGLIVAGVSAVGLVVIGFARLRRARLMEDTPRSRIRSAAQGYVELGGRAGLLPGPEIVSPLTRQRCCWWDYRVELRRRTFSNGKYRDVWQTVEAQTSAELFLLDDGTGRCIVDPGGAKVWPSLRRQWRGGTRVPQRVPKKSQWISFGSYRYTERLIRLDDPLYAIGAFRTEQAVAGPGEAEAFRARLVELKKDQAGLLARFDANQDGLIDAAEWETARRQVRAEAMQTQVEPAVAPDLNVLSRPADRRPFILSTQPESVLSRRFRWQGWGGIVAGITSGALTVYAAIVRGVLT